MLVRMAMRWSLRREWRRIENGDIRAGRLALGRLLGREQPAFLRHPAPFLAIITIRGLLEESSPIREALVGPDADAEGACEAPLHHGREKRGGESAEGGAGIRHAHDED